MFFEAQDKLNCGQFDWAPNCELWDLKSYFHWVNTILIFFRYQEEAHIWHFRTPRKFGFGSFKWLWSVPQQCGDVQARNEKLICSLWKPHIEFCWWSSKVLCNTYFIWSGCQESWLLPAACNPGSTDSSEEKQTHSNAADLFMVNGRWYWWEGSQARS